MNSILKKVLTAALATVMTVSLAAIPAIAVEEPESHLGITIEGSTVYANGVSIVVKKGEDGKAYVYDGLGSEKLSDTAVSTIYGGSKNQDIIGNVSITVEDVKLSNIYGGGYSDGTHSANVTGNVSIVMNSSSPGAVRGGGNAIGSRGTAKANVTGDIAITTANITNGSTSTNFSGGGSASADKFDAQANVGNVSISTGGRIYTIRGGGSANYAGSGSHPYNAEATAKNIVIDVKDGDVREIYGGGYANDIDAVVRTADAGNISITATNSEIMVLEGGGHASGTGASACVNNVDIDLVECPNLYGYFYGGGKTYDGGTATAKDVTFTLTDCIAPPDEQFGNVVATSICGGGYANGEGSVSSVGDTTLTVNGGVYINGLIGGGEATAGGRADSGNINMSITGVKGASYTLKDDTQYYVMRVIGGSEVIEGHAVQTDVNISVDNSELAMVIGGNLQDDFPAIPACPVSLTLGEGNENLEGIAYINSLSLAEAADFSMFLPANGGTAVTLAGEGWKTDDIVLTCALGEGDDPDTWFTITNGMLIQEKTDSSAVWKYAAVVAAVGDKEFATMDDAIAAAKDGDTIKILRDATLSSPITPKKSLTFEGMSKYDGSIPVIKATGANGLFSLSGNYALTLRELNLQTARDGNWTIYHSAGVLTTDKCQFTMTEGVAFAGNIIMGEGGANKKLVFTNNTVSVNSRSAFVGLGNDSVFTGNTIDLLSDRVPSGGRTSVISLTTDAAAKSIKISGNTFKNANRVLAVDNAVAMPANKLVYNGNRFIDVRYAFELDSNKNASCGTYDISKNYYINGTTISAPLVEDANAQNTSHFDDSSLYKGNQVKTNPYYVRDAIGDSTALSDYSPATPDPGPVIPPPTTDTETTVDGDITTETTTETTTNPDGSKTTDITQTQTNATTGEKTEIKSTKTVGKDGSMTKEEVKVTTAADGTRTEEKVIAIVDAKTGTSTTANVKTDADGKSSAEVIIENTKDAKSVSIPATAIKSAAKADEVSMMVKTSAASITLDAGAVAAIAAAEGETVSVAAERVRPEALPEAARETLKGAIVVDLSITVGEYKVESFNGGKATVTVPYRKTDADKGVGVYFVNEVGVIKRVPGAKYNEEADSVTFVTEHFSFYAVKEETVPPYTDVAETAWYYDAVQYVYEQKLFYGTSAVTFDPMLDMSREMLATVLYRKAGSPVTAGMALDEFTDSGKISDWAKEAMLWAVSEGIILGKGSGILAPRDSVTRQEIVVILHRIADSPDTEAVSLDSFTDSGSVAPWAKSAVEWAVAKGVLQGRDDGRLAPEDTATRCEVAVLLMRSK